MDQAKITELLRDAQHSVKLSELLPAPFWIAVGSHDTGCQPYIYARAEGLPQVLVWKGSIWYSSSYAFNDRDNVLGYQPDCDWAKPALDKFFQDVAEAWATVQADRALAKIQQQSSYQRQHNDAMDQYKKMITPNKE